MKKVDENLKEIRPHGDHLFPINVYETVVETEFHLPLHYHWHPEIEILTITTGRACFQVNGEQVIVEAGDILVVKANVLHGSYSCFRRLMKFRAVVFDYSFIAGVTNDRIEQRYLKTLLGIKNGEYILIQGDCDEKARLFGLINDVYETCKSKRDGYELLVKAQLFQVMYYIYLLSPQPSVQVTQSSDHVLMMRRIIEYSKDHFREKITLSDVAKELSVSEGYFCRFFQKHFYMTYGHYLSIVRMQEAEHLLRETDLSIEQVAINAGFGSGNYFTIQFKKMNQITPLAWRKQQIRIGK